MTLGVFGYLILISRDSVKSLRQCLTTISKHLKAHAISSNISNMSDSVSSGYPNTEKRVEVFG